MTNKVNRQRQIPPPDDTKPLTLKMTSAQVFKISLIITNSSFQNYTQPDDHTRQSTEDTHGFKLFTPKIILMFIPGGWGGGEATRPGTEKLAKRSARQRF